MQKTLKLKTTDKKHIIYGTLDYESTRTNKLIIFVHGLTGHQNEHQFFNGAKFFTKQGYATCRFDLYTGENKGRLLKDCTTYTHSEDLNRVINHFKRKYKDIYLVGHSLGGPTILYADLTSINSIVLWDPTINLSEEDEELKYDKNIKRYFLNWGTSYLINKKMVNEWNKIADYKDIANSIQVPLCIICAGKGDVLNDWGKALKYFHKPNKLIVIKNAGHNFNELGTEEKLFQETLKWINKY